MSEPAAKRHMHCFNHTTMEQKPPVQYLYLVRMEWCCQCGLMRPRVKYRRPRACAYEKGPTSE